MSRLLVAQNRLQLSPGLNRLATTADPCCCGEPPGVECCQSRTTQLPPGFLPTICSGDPYGTGGRGFDACLLGYGIEQRLYSTFTSNRPDSPCAGKTDSAEFIFTRTPKVSFPFYLPGVVGECRAIGIFPAEEIEEYTVISCGGDPGTLFTDRRRRIQDVCIGFGAECWPTSPGVQTSTNDALIPFIARTISTGGLAPPSQNCPLFNQHEALWNNQSGSWSGTCFVPGGSPQTGTTYEWTMQRSLAWESGLSSNYSDTRTISIRVTAVVSGGGPQTWTEISTFDGLSIGRWATTTVPILIVPECPIGPGSPGGGCSPTTTTCDSDEMYYVGVACDGASVPSNVLPPVWNVRNVSACRVRSINGICWTVSRANPTVPHSSIGGRSVSDEVIDDASQGPFNCCQCLPQCQPFSAWTVGNPCHLPPSPPDSEGCCCTDEDLLTIAYNDYSVEALVDNPSFSFGGTGLAGDYYRFSARDPWRSIRRGNLTSGIDLWVARGVFTQKRNGVESDPIIIEQSYPPVFAGCGWEPSLGGGLDRPNDFPHGFISAPDVGCPARTYPEWVPHVEWVRFNVTRKCATLEFDIEFYLCTDATDITTRQVRHKGRFVLRANLDENCTQDCEDGTGSTIDPFSGSLRPSTQRSVGGCSGCRSGGGIE